MFQYTAVLLKSSMMFTEDGCRHGTPTLEERSCSRESLPLCSWMVWLYRHKQVQAFESQACLRTLRTHFVTRGSRKELAGRSHSLALESFYLEQTETFKHEIEVIDGLKTHTHTLKS